MFFCLLFYNNKKNSYLCFNNKIIFGKIYPFLNKKNSRLLTRKDFFWKWKRFIFRVVKSKIKVENWYLVKFF